MQKKVILIHEDVKLGEALREMLVAQGYNVLPLNAGDKPNPEDLVIAPGGFASEIERLTREAPNSESVADGKTASPETAAAALNADAKAAQDAEEKLKAFQGAFQLVKTKYARALPDKVAELERNVKVATDNSAASEELEAVRQISHKLVGTAGSYGYEQFALYMREIEQAAIEISRTNDQAEISASWKKINQALAKGINEAGAVAEQALALSAKQNDDAPIRGPVFARVLLVDKDKEFLDRAEQLGRQCNVAVLKATDGPTAMNLALMHQLDAAIIDVEFESQDISFNLAMDLRSLPDYDTVPLAFISSDAKMRPMVEAAHVGASLHLDKPLEETALEAAVRHLVSIRQGGRPKVMIVDDDPDFTARIALDLHNDNLLVRSVHDPMKVLDALQEFPPDVLLLDVMMPGKSGFEVCQMLRALPRWRDLPIIFITAEINTEARVKAFVLGGDDYLPKPVVREELLARVRVRLEKSRLLKERSDKDTITGLLLRRAFVEQFNAMLADAERGNLIVSICIVDLDHFKKVNDTYGHMAGDRVLARFGQLLLRRFRVDDLRGRWGGEEFILAFRRETKETMRAALDRVQEEFSSIVFESDNGRQFQASFSGGIASFPEDGAILHELLQVADKRLYDAKHAGRKRVYSNDNEGN